MPMPSLTDALYADYARTGTRFNFERPYFERRRCFARAAISLLTEGHSPNPGTIRSFLLKLEDIFAEVSWALPAHINHPSGQDSRTLELFGCETANLMGECFAVFSPFIPLPLQTRIRERLRQDYFENYCENDFFWMHASHNWNAVCHQGILGAALAIEDDAELLADLFLKARTHLPVFLNGYGEDGGCSEGPTYWDYGFGWFTALNEQLEMRTSGQLSLFAGNPKVHAIAGYGPAMSLLKGHLVNFADCDPRHSLRPSTLAYLGLALNHPECRTQAKENYAQCRAEETDYDAERSDFFYWTRFFLYAPAHRPAAMPAKRDRFFPSLGVWSVRGRDLNGRIWELAAKGGHNDEHHNHNDIGSFILSIDGVPLITEIGMPEYTGAYFDPAQRYHHLAARTRGHSLPLINGHEQHAGPGFRGVVLRSDTSGSPVTFEADLTQAYPAQAGCRSFIRRFTLHKEQGLVCWVDEIELHAPGVIESASLTDAEEVVLESPRLAVIRKQGKTVELHCEDGPGWREIEVLSYQSHEGRPAYFRRLVQGTPPEETTTTLTTSVCMKMRS